VLSRLLNKFAQWALAHNASGSYKGEDDKRWAYVIETDGSKYLTRVLFPRVFGVRVLLHHFHRKDIDRHLHSHPWKWTRSLVISGAYDEERLAHPEREGCLDTIERTVTRFNKLDDKDYHRVTKLHGDVWTLFVTGPRCQDWGFLTDRGHVSWREYLGKE
jgi:hypothetical protein